MKKIIIAITMIFLIAVMVDTALFPDSLLRAFASHDLSLQILRTLLVGFLITLLVTSPPRSLRIRASLAAVAATIGIFVPIAVYENMVPLLDAMLFMEIGIIFALEALETPDLVSPGMSKPKIGSTASA